MTGLLTHPRVAQIRIQKSNFLTSARSYHIVKTYTSEYMMSDGEYLGAFERLASIPEVIENLLPKRNLLVLLRHLVSAISANRSCRNSGRRFSFVGLIAVHGGRHSESLVSDAVVNLRKRERYSELKQNNKTN